MVAMSAWILQGLWASPTMRICVTTTKCPLMNGPGLVSESWSCAVAVIFLKCICMCVCASKRIFIFSTFADVCCSKSVTTILKLSLFLSFLFSPFFFIKYVCPLNQTNCRKFTHVKWPEAGQHATVFKESAMMWQVVWSTVALMV